MPNALPAPPTESLLLFLGIAPCAHSFRCLAQLVETSPAMAEKALCLLEQEGLARRLGPGKRWQLCAGKAVEKALEQAKQAWQQEGIAGPPLVQALVLLQAGEVLGGCERLLDNIKVFIRDGASAATLFCLDVLIDHLGRWKHESRSDADIRRYLVLVQRTQGISMYMAKSVERALALLPRARQAARKLGDMRVLLLLDLMEACQQHLTLAHNTEHPHSLLARTLESIRSLGDPDILALTAHAIGILHFMQAEYRSAIEYLQQGSVRFFVQRFDYLEEMRLRYIGSAACNLGQWDLAAGCVVSALREALLSGQKLTAKWYQVHLADELLRMGRREEALELLDGILPCCDPESETKLWIWALRSLAFYHFQSGRIRVAHRILSEGMARSMELGLPRPYYGFSWLFDMLWAFHKSGLPAVPGYDFEREVAAALHSPSRMLQGAALRIRALQQEFLGAGPDKVAALARQSLHHATAVSHPLEIARCHLVLARCLYRQAATQEADRLQDSAYRILGRYQQYDCPPARAGSLAEGKEGDIRVYVPPAAFCIRRCQKALEALPPWHVLEEHLQRLVACARESLEVERVGLFHLTGKDSLHCLAACHISTVELQSEAFRPFLHWMLGCAGKLARMTGEEGAVLCVPLPLPNGEHYLLFAQSLYTVPSIEAQDVAVFHAVGAACIQELRAALLLQERMLETRQLAEEKARLAAVRLDSKEAPHYGLSMQDMLRQTDQAAATDASVCILGETGVGKEMLARRIHAHSGRIGPFVPVHPASMPESLFESEFFGHEKGAFTGAHRQKIGLVEVADKGTLFIDELGDVPMALQTKLLRVLQEKAFLRVGGTCEIHSDFRLITATNRDLQQMIRQGSFREDLYYRVSVVPLHLPPLRDRPEDVLMLAPLFLERYARRYQRTLPALSVQEQQQLRAYPWPGNIRELKSVMERTVILYAGGSLHFDLPQKGPLAEAHSPEPSGELAKALHWDDLPSMEALQGRYLHYVLRHTHGKVDGEQGAMAILGMKRATLYAKIKKYGLDSASQLYGERAQNSLLGHRLHGEEGD